MPHFGSLIATAYVLGLTLLAIVMLVRRSLSGREIAGRAFPTLLGTLADLDKRK
jgi:hypothetical protein